MSTYPIASLLGRKLTATDGEIGAIHDVYFSDASWRVEHIVIQTGSRFRSRQLLLDPKLLHPDHEAAEFERPGVISLDAPRSALLHAPGPSSDPPVTEQKAHHPRLHPYLLWMPAGDATKLVSRPRGAATQDLAEEDEEARAHGYNPHLRSLREVRGYAPHLVGDRRTTIGHVFDFVATHEDHHIVQVLLHTRDASGMHDLATPPENVQHIDWADVCLYLYHAPEAAALTAQ